ncbi:MAG: alpha/beta fold hydrolase [Pseudomonadota bacterium]
MAENAMELNFKQKGDGQPIILMHGMFGSLSNLGVVSRHFANEYHTISVDLRNHGDSPHTPNMSYPEMANDVLALMDKIGIKQAHLLGHSMGGKVAMQLALTHPSRADKVVVADISPVQYGARHDDVLAGLTALNEQDIQSRNHARDILEKYVSEAGVSSFLLKNVHRREDGTFGLKINLNAILDNYFDSLTLAPKGESYEGQVLFVKGQNSPYIEESHRPEILRLFPKAELKIIHNTGHWLHAERPDTFNRVVESFLSK